ncbi:NADPH-dependent 1-acyldihydroxyacetone phosphate reductase-like [Pyrus ussuriensis x Pyrus communis]|uniref:NADPH-dependent 1-acyldihydroxyacetone phosphate reductase-like n=1 Tax=Pyrus ussuriensis x Pyrus communis TaxID=2448454 RepID=A0A5N5GWG4_9ROSA|nr:NADPH-dependent 1-acyldihydroxyacetone phosphate reductase-like [Pyrus ussuriensis x Pyrus communis]
MVEAFARHAKATLRQQAHVVYSDGKFIPSTNFLQMLRSSSILSTDFQQPAAMAAELELILF